MVSLGNSRARAGRQAERRAARYLKAQGLSLVEYNYSSRFGEIDIVLKDQEQWIFVEVRSRAQANFMRPEESISLPKQRRLWLTGQAYLQQLPNGSHASARFDVVAVLAGECQWIQNAFVFG